jgi:hypothetical protein
MRLWAALDSESSFFCHDTGIGVVAVSLVVVTIEALAFQRRRHPRPD